MIRRICASLTIVTLLAACGGGGGGTSPSNSFVPKTPSSGMGTAKFAFKIPGKATMTKLRRPYYQSQATAGVAIDWVSTDPTHPDYAAAISATCPGTLPAGVTACTIDAQGGTDYTFQLQIPAGTYTFKVSTFDTAPSGGVFTGNMLAQGQLAAPVVITAGQANTISSLTFYGIPAAVSFVPAPAQSHVSNFTGGYAIIGNTPQTFYAQATDADGFAIGSTDPGAPSVTMAESTSDSPQYLSIAATTNPYAFTLAALQAPASPTTVANVNVTATAGGTGLPAITTPYAVTPVQELWTTQSSGGTSSSYGLNGYALYPPNYTASAPLDFTLDPTPDSLCSASNACSFEPAAVFPDGGVAAIGVNGPALVLFGLPSGSQPPALPSAALPPALSGSSPSNVAIDAAGHIFITDNSFGTLGAYVGASTPAAQATGLAAPTGLAIAPSGIASISALAQTIWVGTHPGSGTPLAVYAPYNGSLTPVSLAPVAGSNAMPAGINALGFDSNGNLWMFDGTYFYTAAISGSLSTSITITPQLATAFAPAIGTSGSTFGATAQGAMWMGQIPSYTGMYPFTLSGCPASCAITQGSIVQTGAPVDAAIVVP